jgi:hypothetical protein
MQADVEAGVHRLLYESRLNVAKRADALVHHRIGCFVSITQTLLAC